MKKIILIIFLTAILAGCVHMQQPSPQEIASADYGSLPDDYQQQIISRFDQTLIDPFSAIYSYCDPFKTWMGRGVGRFGSREAVYTYGWAVCGEVNAKNRMGGYAGGMQFFAFFSDGRLDTLYTKGMASGPCRNHVYGCSSPQKRQ